MGTKFQDIETIIKNNRNLVKELFKSNNITEMTIPKTEFGFFDEDGDYIVDYFSKVTLDKNDILLYGSKYGSYYKNIPENSMNKFLDIENKILKYLYKKLKK